LEMFSNSPGITFLTVAELNFQSTPMSSFQISEWRQCTSRASGWHSFEWARRLRCRFSRTSRYRRENSRTRRRPPCRAKLANQAAAIQQGAERGHHDFVAVMRCRPALQKHPFHRARGIASCTLRCDPGREELSISFDYRGTDRNSSSLSRDVPRPRPSSAW